MKTHIRYFFTAFVALTLILMISSCDLGEPIVPTHDRTETELGVTVFLYDSVRDVNRAYRLAHQLPPNAEIPDQWGFAIWPEWRDPDGKSQPAPPGERYTCEVHTVRPSRVDDNHVTTLGHEMLHCVYGSYHRVR